MVAAFEAGDADHELSGWAESRDLVADGGLRAVSGLTPPYHPGGTSDDTAAHRRAVRRAYHPPGGHRRPLQWSRDPPRRPGRADPEWRCADQPAAWALYDFANTIFSYAVVSVAIGLWLTDDSRFGAGPGQLIQGVAIAISVGINALRVADPGRPGRPRWLRTPVPARVHHRVHRADGPHRLLPRAGRCPPVHRRELRLPGGPHLLRRDAVRRELSETRGKLSGIGVGVQLTLHVGAVGEDQPLALRGLLARAQRPGREAGELGGAILVGAGGQGAGDRLFHSRRAEDSSRLEVKGFRERTADAHRRVAGRAGEVSLIRYYEEIGLLQPISGQRRYDDTARTAWP